MTRSALLLSFSLLVLPFAARAQAPAAVPLPSSPPVPSQLDRIEGKLDELLRRMDQARPQPPGAGQGAAATSPTGSGAPSAAPGETYKPGALAVARAAPRDINGLAEVPPDSVGGFVYEGGPIPFTDIRTRGVRYAGPVGVELQGWLRAREAGRYQIGADLTAAFKGSPLAPTCYLQAWLEGRSLDGRSVLVSSPGRGRFGIRVKLVTGSSGPVSGACPRRLAFSDASGAPAITLKTRRSLDAAG